MECTQGLMFSMLIKQRISKLRKYSQNSYFPVMAESFQRKLWEVRYREWKIDMQHLVIVNFLCSLQNGVSYKLKYMFSKHYFYLFAYFYFTHHLQKRYNSKNYRIKKSKWLSTKHEDHIVSEPESWKWTFRKYCVYKHITSQLNTAVKTGKLLGYPWRFEK